MNSVTAAASPMPTAVPATGLLPRAGSVLVVTARPAQEPADLGGLPYAFRRGGASLAMLCLTRGGASPLDSGWSARLEAIRLWEPQLAANILGISRVTVASYPDDALQPGVQLAWRVGRAIRQYASDLLLVIDPAAGNPDDTAVAAAACAAARQAGVPALARTARDVRGAWMIDLGGDAATARAVHKSPAAAHASQPEALPRLLRRLDPLDGREYLRWLVPPPRDATAYEKPATVGYRRAGGQLSRRPRPAPTPDARAPGRPKDVRCCQPAVTMS